MAVLTPATTDSAQGIFKIFRFSAVNDTDTFASTKVPRAYWAASSFNPATQGSAGVNVSYASNTYTFYPGENANVTVFLFVIE